MGETAFFLFPSRHGRDNALSNALVNWKQLRLMRFKRRLIMTLTRILTVLILGCAISMAGPCYAQLGAGPQDAARILNSMPPDLLSKVQALAQILEQGIKDGKLTDAEIQQDMLSGRLGERLTQLSPEAGQLLKDITDASKQGRGPGEESLIPLLGGLGLSGQ
jgi:hypothetical protein